MKYDPKLVYLQKHGFMPAIGGTVVDPKTEEVWTVDYAYSVQKSREKNRPFDSKKFLKQAMR